MKKFVGIIVLLVVCFMVIGGQAEPANTYDRAYKVLEKYCEAYNKNMFMHDTFDGDGYYTYGLGNKEYFLSKYGLDFDNVSLEEFKAFYINEATKNGMLPNSDVWVYQVARYEDTDIYEIDIYNTEDMIDWHDECQTMIRMLVIMY